MIDNIEHLKRRQVQSRSTSDHVFFEQVGVEIQQPPVELEAYGGTGQKATSPVNPAVVADEIVQALKNIYDPEIPVNIYDLGLIYNVEVTPEGRAEVQMTLTAPACPVAGMLVEAVAAAVGQVDGVCTSHVEVVWDPPWTPDRMTEAAKLELGML